MVYTLSRVPVRSGVAAVPWSWTSAGTVSPSALPFMLYTSGASFGLLPSALRNVFYSGSLSTFAVHASGFRLPLTLKSISHFRLSVKKNFVRFNHSQKQNAVVHLTFRIIAHSALNVKNFLTSVQLSSPVRLPSLTAFRPCRRPRRFLSVNAVWRSVVPPSFHRLWP